jgi:hypothetical protein
MTKNQLRYIVCNSDWKFLFLFFLITKEYDTKNPIDLIIMLFIIIVVSLVSNYFRKEAEKDGQK